MDMSRRLSHRERLRDLSCPLEEEKAQGDLPTVYKYSVGGGRGKEDGAILISVEPSRRRKDSGHKLKYSKFHLSTRKSFFTG